MTGHHVGARDLSPALQQHEPFEKTYHDRASATRAVANYEWLAALGPPLRTPRLLQIADRMLRFERLDGSHVAPEDLVAVAAHLGEVQAAAHQLHLHSAALDQDFVAELPGGQRHRIPSFLTGRLDAVARLLDSGAVTQPIIDADAARTLMTAAIGQPVAFYKDANPRNLLVPAAGGDRGHGLPPATIDFDDLTLAPFGYDLAKLVVGLAMTWGGLPDDLIASSLTAYNAALQRCDPGLRPVSMDDFIGWAEIHHVLTSGYLRRNGYRYSWHQLRPSTLMTAAGRSAAAGPLTPERDSR